MWIDTHSTKDSSMTARRGSIWMLVVLAVLLGFASISTDLFLPALPTMQAQLGAREGALHFVISAYLLGFAFGQLGWGPISDRYGRRGPIAVGVLVFVLGSAGCALSTSAGEIIGWRVVQALGASAGVALARAMIRDLYDRDEAARTLSTLMTVMAVAPLLGPLVGAQILEIASWQAIFWTLVAIGLATFAAVMTLPESLSTEKREHGSVLTAISGYGEILTNTRLLAYAAVIGFFYAAIFASVAGTPFVLIEYFGESPQTYSLIFSAGIIGLMGANTLNARFVNRVGSDQMLRLGALGAALFGLALLVTSLADMGGVVAFVVLQFLFTAMNGLILANGVAGALASVDTRAGSASAVVGAVQYGSGMLGSAAVGLLADGTPAPMLLVMAIGGIGASLTALWMVRQKRET
jgi:DHA1 family bicyclomycin/chloramphenicol resistance-like MFS transporter